jgi:hypothetical protein
MWDSRAEPNPRPWAACSTPRMNRYQCGGPWGCRSSMRFSPPNTDGVRRPRNRTSGGSSRSRRQRDACHLPGGGNQTAAAAPSPVIQIWSCGKASLRRRNSMKAGRTARRCRSSGNTQAMTGSSWKAEASARASRGASAGIALRTDDAAAMTRFPRLSSTGRLASYPWFKSSFRSRS